ncbi:MAG: hypothetical protein LUD50_03175 [Clostridia bacterium]|nr:hypothetical protein [Clostridia bacterium]
MKRLILFLSAALISVAAIAQSSASVIMDAPNSDGYRSVLTNEINCRTGFTDRTPFFIALGAIVMPDESVAYVLHIRINCISSFTVREGAAALIKLDSGEIIELENSLPEIETGDPLGKPVPGSSTMRSYDMHAAYEISEADIQRIVSGSIAKIRLEVSDRLIDETYKTDKVGDAVRAQFAALSETLSEKRDIYTDF